MYTEVDANLLDYSLDGFVHQANCFCTMGSGIAKSIRAKYPEMYELDCETGKGDINKFGNFSVVQCHDGKWGYNLYSQFRYGSDGKKYTSYDAFDRGIKLIAIHAEEVGIKTLGFPCRIGCVLGGGSWSVVKAIILDVFGKSTMTVCICNYQG